MNKFFKSGKFWLSTLAIIAAIVVLFKISYKESVNYPRGLFHVWACMWVGCNPIKTIDPIDPNFRSENFKFADYPGINWMQYAIPHILKVDMTRVEVDRILIDSAQSKIRSSGKNANGEDSALYAHPKPGLFGDGDWVIKVNYSDGKVKKVELY